MERRAYLVELAIIVGLFLAIFAVASFSGGCGGDQGKILDRLDREELAACAAPLVACAAAPEPARCILEAAPRAVVCVVQAARDGDDDEPLPSPTSETHTEPRARGDQQPEP